MMRTLFEGGALPPRERLAALHDLFVTSEHPMGVHGVDPDGFAAAARAVDLSAVNVVELTVSPSQIVRTAKMVRQSDPELVCVVVARSGRAVMTQAGRDAVLQANDMVLYDSSRPFVLRLGAAGDEPVTLLRAQIPRALLRAGNTVEPLLARPLPGDGGFAGMIVQLLDSLADDRNAYRPGDHHRLSEIAADLLNALVAHHLDADPVPGDDSRAGALLLSVEAFVRQHLHDPDLSPGVIADAHHLSVGYLHRLFSTRGTTLAAWIRGLRLKHAGRDLRDPSLRDVAVHQIASRWGFKDHSTFTRSFRTAYGMSPRDYRHSALGRRAAGT